MSAEMQKPAPSESNSAWTGLPPAKLPEPSIWPVTLAVAITFLVWGLVTSLIITGVGGILFVVALAGWIRDIRYERA